MWMLFLSNKFPIFVLKATVITGTFQIARAAKTRRLFLFKNTSTMPKVNTDQIRIGSNKPKILFKLHGLIEVNKMIENIQNKVFDLQKLMEDNIDSDNEEIPF